MRLRPTARQSTALRTAPATARRLTALGSVLVVSTVAGSAVAQFDVAPPLPNVMLLVDTSGSMEKMTDGSLPESCEPNGTSDLNRWGTLTEVLTGTVQNRGCFKQKRSSPDFVQEFTWLGQKPYDETYFLPFHRMVSNGCVAGPGVVPTQVFDWPTGAIGFHPWDNPNGTCVLNPFVQSNDGLLDAYRDRLRFGLMTFDSRTDKGTGYTGMAVNPSDGVDGLWSYYFDTFASGHPPNCQVQNQEFEVGARNAAAPPWEGRLLSPGPSTAGLDDTQRRNAEVQGALIAMRPFGATPLAGMLQDALDFIRKDNSTDPLTGDGFGIAGDALFQNGCRDTYVVVLSDGEPNLDLRPDCEESGDPDGKCPFKQPYEIAKELYDGSPHVKTFAVGFGLSEASGVDCTELKMPEDFDAGQVCDNPSNASVKACCTLARIAYEGGTENAYFADDKATLKQALSDVLNFTVNSTSRTLPIFSAASGAASDSNAPARSYEFSSSLNPNTNSLWNGNLQRKRTICVEDEGEGTIEAEVVPVDEGAGDDFAANLNSGTGPVRKFLTVIADTKSLGGVNVIPSGATIRPYLADDDGLGTIGGSIIGEGLNVDAGDMANELADDPLAMQLVPLPNACLADNLLAGTPALCAEKVMLWALGGDTADGFPTRQGDALGAIYHSTPAVVGSPSEFLRDSSYLDFAEVQGTRELMLYAATVDGQLHAFKVASNDPDDVDNLVDKLENNELWSFLPPAVLPSMISQYPNTQQILLDGPPVVQDIVYERTTEDAEAGAAKWNTVLVAGGRGGGGVYYALDVTDPADPKFLWQISSTLEGQGLFGNISGKPAIATLAINIPGDEGFKEVAVAILPGGFSGDAADPDCPAGQPRSSDGFGYIDDSYKPRASVRCWADGPWRSLTIVRLDTGEIIKSFRSKAADGPSALDDSRVKIVPFDSPVTGDPVPYPGGAGKVSDRIYVGDADGTLWHIDLSKRDPNEWGAFIAWDGYSLGSDTYDSGQPIDTTPVVAVDGLGNTVLLFSTGDQELFSSVAEIQTRVWSVLQVPEAGGGAPFQMKANWYIDFDKGKRVTGPIALFNSIAYFSTFEPTDPGAAACSDGFGSLWGVDYLDAIDDVVGNGPEPRLDVNGDIVAEDKQDPGTVVFGVAVTQVPTCFTSETVADDYVGSHTALGALSAPQYQLVFQTGAVGKADGNAKTNTGVKSLPAPPSRTRIDSWATVMD